MAVSDVLCAPWATSADLNERQRAQVPPEVTDEELDRSLTVASEILWALTGRRWLGSGDGCAEVATLRANPPGTGMWPYARDWGACPCWLDAGAWSGGRHIPGLAWRDRHTVRPLAVRLPRSPVVEVTSVEIGGEPFDGWEFTRAGWLTRTDGRTWSMCDDSTVVTYRFGEPPPLGGQVAAIELGVQLTLASVGADDCQLPKRTTSVTRQGVTYTMIDPAEYLDQGRVGLPSVDMWIKAVNPHARPQGATVWSPDIPRAQRSTP